MYMQWIEASSSAFSSSESFRRLYSTVCRRLHSLRRYRVPLPLLLLWLSFRGRQIVVGCRSSPSSLSHVRAHRNMLHKHTTRRRVEKTSFPLLAAPSSLLCSATMHTHRQPHMNSMLYQAEYRVTFAVRTQKEMSSSVGTDLARNNVMREFSNQILVINRLFRFRKCPNSSIRLFRTKWILMENNISSCE